MGALPALADGTGDIGVDEIHFPDELFREYVAENADTDGDGLLSAEEIADVHGIHVRFHGIQDLTGIEHFTALAYLDCSANSLTSLDVSKNAALQSLDCYSNQLTELDVSKNTALSELNCGDNQLTALDVSGNGALVYLNCGSNRLTELDVSKNAALQELSCSGNQLTALDVTASRALVYLECAHNQLTALDVTANGALRSLYCSDNQLTALDVTENGALERLDCGSNRLMALEVPDDAVYDRLIGGAQSPTAEVAGSADGTWSVDLAALVPGWAERVNNVTVTGAEMDGSVVTWSDGSVQPTVVYHYDTDSGDAWVELTLIPVEASDASDASDADLRHKKP